MQFTLDADGFETVAWPAVSQGPRWNGWVTPVVTEPVARQVLAGLDRAGAARTVWHADGTATVYDPEHPRDLEHAARLAPGLHPLARGQVTYDLAPLGMRFEIATEQAPAGAR